MGDGDIAIHAELLANLRQVSVVASLQSPPNSRTRAQISEDGCRIRVSHEEKSRELGLPAAVTIKGVLPVRPGKANEVTWRLPQVAGQAQHSPFRLEEQEIPWTAADLSSSCEISCRECSQVLVDKGAIKTWKDLPSENWAEMMDFWHCHKPVSHEHGGTDDELARRGYGANSAIRPERGSALVDIASFILTRDDCAGVESSEANADVSEAMRTLSLAEEPVRCKTCRAEVGDDREADGSLRLYKWQIRCSGLDECREPEVTTILAASLMSSMSRSGSSKSLVLPSRTVPVKSTLQGTSEPDQVLYCWILNNNVQYTSTNSSGKQTCIKLLFRLIGRAEADGILESMTSTVQEVVFPAAAIPRALDHLDTSHAMLPKSERLFQGWQVGMLARW